MAGAATIAGEAGSLDVPRPGDVVDGKYRIEHVLGAGGMGVVLAAHHLHFDQKVALKVLTARDKTALSRFSIEVRSTARLKSAHVARVMDVGTLPAGAPFLVLEYLEGCDLAQLLERRGALSVSEAVEYTLQALEGLAEAHSHGIIHRDLKPANLFLSLQPSGASIIKILDFGISKYVAAGRDATTGKVTDSHTTVGSPLYMSPEQMRARETIDARSDIWSMGVVLFELLTGRTPFPNETLGEVFAAVLERDAPSVTSVRAEVPAALAEAVGRCLRREQRERFADVAELARAVAPFGAAGSAARVERIEQTLQNARVVGGGAVPTPGSGRRPADDETVEITRSGAHAIGARGGLVTESRVTAHVALTSDTPRSGPGAVTALSPARRGRRRVLLTGAVAVTIVGALTFALGTRAVDKTAGAAAAAMDPSLRSAPNAAREAAPSSPLGASAPEPRTVAPPAAMPVSSVTPPLRPAPPARAPSRGRPVARPPLAAPPVGRVSAKGRPSVLDSPD